MKLLIVEDEVKLARAVKKGLEHERFAVDVARDGAQGLLDATSQNYDALIVDWMMPEMSGPDMVAALRAKNVHTPVLMLTARDTTADTVAALNTGADDYLVKPFEFDELVARVRALLRRPARSVDAVLRVADVTLDPSSFSVSRAGQHIDLSAKEFALLEFFMRQPGETLAKDKIIEHVWDFDADILPNTLEAFVAALRKKLEKPFPKKPRLIHTLRGFGYRFGLEEGAKKG